MILLDDFEKIKRFHREVSKFIDNIDLVKDRYVVDAKSTMGIFTMDLSKPIKVILHSNNINEIEKFKKLIEEFSKEGY